MAVVSPIRDYPPDDLPITKLVWRDSQGVKWRKYVWYTGTPGKDDPYYEKEWRVVPVSIEPREGSEHAYSYVHEENYRTRCGHRSDLCQCVLKEFK